MLEPILYSSIGVLPILDISSKNLFIDVPPRMNICIFYHQILANKLYDNIISYKIRIFKLYILVINIHRKKENSQKSAKDRADPVFFREEKRLKSRNVVPNVVASSTDGAF